MILYFSDFFCKEYVSFRHEASPAQLKNPVCLSFMEPLFKSYRRSIWIEKIVSRKYRYYIFLSQGYTIETFILYKVQFIEVPPHNWKVLTKKDGRTRIFVQIHNPGHLLVADKSKFFVLKYCNQKCLHLCDITVKYL